MHPGETLRRLLVRDRILVAPGAHDALTARIVERVGFEAVYLTGYGQAASHLGQPDVGLLTLTEMTARVRNIACAVSVPVICDGDTGFGGVINVVRTVREYEAAGAAAIQLEDQVFPKRCGHMTGREVVSVEEMEAKIRAAVAARSSESFLIVARTDARTTRGLDEAVARGRAYHQAGADVIFVESPESVEELQRVARSFDAPVLANMVEGGRTPFVTAADLEAMGFSVVIFPASSVFLTAGVLTAMMADLRREGTTKRWMERMLPFQECNELLGLSAVERIEEPGAGGAGEGG